MISRIASTVLLIALINYATSDPAPVPDPNPAAEPGKHNLKPSAPVIEEEPTDLIVIRNNPARFYCRATGFPDPTVEWLKDGVYLQPGETRILMPNGEIVFYRVRNHNDEGLYQCVAKNSRGEARSRNATLRIAFIKDDFRTIPKDTVVAVGEKAVIECKGPRGLPEPTISWKKDGNQIQTVSGRIKIVDGDLVISGSRKSDSGSYQCVAGNDAGKRNSIEALLAVLEPPRFILQPKATTVVAGSRVELTCEAQGEPKPRIRWTRIDGNMPNARIVPLSNGNLRITNIQAEDEGRYACNAENRAGQKSVSALITVQTEPEFNRFPQDMTARVGTTVTLSCSASGKPKPAILWHVTDGINMFPENSYQDGHLVVSTKGDLTIYDVHFSDEGQYTCQALSPVGQITAQAKLTVQPRQNNVNPPIIRQGPANQTVVLGGTVELRCATSAVPVPVLEWSKEGYGVINSESRFTVTRSGSLKIKSIQNSDAARYTCTATNDYGRSKWDAWLKVVGKGTEVKAPNDDITQVPGSPTAPTLVNATSETITLRWQSNSYAGASPVTGYILEYFCLQSRSASWVRVNRRITNSVFTVRDLSPASRYVFIVRTVNTHGVSDPSNPSGQIGTKGNNPYSGNERQTELKRKLDGISVRVTQAKPQSLASPSASISLSWEAATNCDAVDGFRIYFQPVSVRNSQSSSIDTACYARETELKNLVPRTIYEIRIRPYKDDVTGQPSPIILSSLESEGTSPMKPSLTVNTRVPEDNSLASADFRWECPDGILPQYIAQYSLHCYAKDARDLYDVTLTLNNSVNRVTLQDLPRGHDFVASLLFSTRLGAGVPSENVKFSVAVGTAAEDNGFMSTIQNNPAILAGIASVVGLIIVIVLGFFLYKKYKKNKKSRGLHGRSDRFENTPYSEGFTMMPTGGKNSYSEGGQGNLSGTNNKSIFLNHDANITSPPPMGRNTTVSLNKSNGNVGTSLASDTAPSARHTSSFSYVTDQLTSMTSIPPQFSSPNLARSPEQTMSEGELQYQIQQQQINRRQSDQTPLLPGEYLRQESGRDMISMHTPTDYTRDFDLPPPPPSPPMSLKTSLSDRTNRSRGSRNSTDRSSNHSTGKSRKSRGQNRVPPMDRVATDTDTGIDSPQQTPSPPRPSELRLDNSSLPPAPQIHGAFPYQSAKPQNPRQPSNRRNDGIAIEYNSATVEANLGYLAGPSEGDTESELDGVRRMRTKNFTTVPEETRNSVTVSSVSMMNAYGSESDCESSCERHTPMSSVESLNMESASQVGVNENQQFMSPRSNHSAFIPIQSQGYPNNGASHMRPIVKPKGRKHPRINERSPAYNGHYTTEQDYHLKPHHGTPAHLLNRVNSASSSGSSSYHQNTADSGMSAGVGSYGHNSLNSSSSAESGSKGQMSRSKTTGSISSENTGSALPENIQNGQGQISSVDRRYAPTTKIDSQPNRGRQPAPHPRRTPKMGTTGSSGSKSPQRENIQDLNLSLPTRDPDTYSGYTDDERQPILTGDYRTNEDESRISFLAAKFGGNAIGKQGRGLPPELSDVPEVSTSDFCEDYSDRSQ